MSPVERVHAILFVAEAPVSLVDLARVLQLTEDQIEQSLEILERQLIDKGPIRLVRLAGGFQLSTKPEFAADIAAYLQPSGSKLSRSLMEVLAVVAYKQPITLSELEAIRGVNCDYGIRALVDRRLVEEKGRKATPGRPAMYGTTDSFLHQFKMNSLEELPPVAEGAFALPVSTEETAETR